MNTFEPLNVPKFPMPTTDQIKKAKNKMQLFDLLFRARCAYIHRHKSEVVLNHEFPSLRSDGTIDPYNKINGTRTVEVPPREIPDFLSTWPQIK